MTKNELVEHLIKKIPTPQMMRDLDLEQEPNAIRFNYDGIRYRVTTDLFVEEVHKGLLSTTATTALMEALLAK